MRRLLFGLIFPWLLSCNVKVICHEYSLSGNYEAWEKKEVEDSFAHWNAFAGSRVLTLREAGYAQCQINRLASKAEAEEMHDEHDDGNGTVRGVYTREGQILFYPPDLGAGWTRSVLMHELGHGLGLEHVRYGVMSPKIVVSVFTPDDHDECKKVGVCSVEWPLDYPPRGAVKQEPW